MSTPYCKLGDTAVRRALLSECFACKHLSITSVETDGMTCPRGGYSIREALDGRVNGCTIFEERSLVSYTPAPPPPTKQGSAYREAMREIEKEQVATERNGDA